MKCTYERIRQWPVTLKNIKSLQRFGLETIRFILFHMYIIQINGSRIYEFTELQQLLWPFCSRLDLKAKSDSRIFEFNVSGYILKVQYHLCHFKYNIQYFNIRDSRELWGATLLQTKSSTSLFQWTASTILDPFDWKASHGHCYVCWSARFQETVDWLGGGLHEGTNKRCVYTCIHF